jgi:hypothetical protein
MLGVFPKCLWQHMMRQPYFEWPEYLQMRLVSRDMVSLMDKNSLRLKVHHWVLSHYDHAAFENSCTQGLCKLLRRKGRFFRVPRTRVLVIAIELIIWCDNLTMCNRLRDLANLLVDRKTYSTRCTLREKLTSIEGAFGHEMVRYLMYAGLLEDTKDTRKRAKMDI